MNENFVMHKTINALKSRDSTFPNNCRCSIFCKISRVLGSSTCSVVARCDLSLRRFSSPASCRRSCDSA